MKNRYSVMPREEFRMKEWEKSIRHFDSEKQAIQYAGLYDEIVVDNATNERIY